jgi:uncharacterized protein (DUF2062 family)
MPRKFFRKYIPSHESIRQSPHFARFGAFLKHPNLWHLNRSSVACGVAIGLFSGLVPGPFQMLTAALLAIALRVNLPVALAVTLYTNPFTIGPLYLLAYKYGRLLVGGDSAPRLAPELDWSQLGDWLDIFLAWMLSLGKPLIVGLIALAFTLAALGWLATRAAWRVHVILAWKKRAAKRQTKA